MALVHSCHRAPNALFPFAPLRYQSSEFLLASIGGIWAVAFFLQNGHNEDAKFMKELFQYFTQRYDQQNNDLQGWLRQKEEFTDKQKLGFIDYFNLCAEESVFQRLGYIYDEVWESWQNGMRQYGRDARVAALWLEQKETNSYYGFEFPLDAKER